LADQTILLSKVSENSHLSQVPYRHSLLVLAVFGCLIESIIKNFSPEKIQAYAQQHSAGLIGDRIAKTVENYLTPLTYYDFLEETMSFSQVSETLQAQNGVAPILIDDRFFLVTFSDLWQAWETRSPSFLPFLKRLKTPFFLKPTMPALEAFLLLEKKDVLYAFVSENNQPYGLISRSDMKKDLKINKNL
jgi:hypothetical protein